MKNLFATEKIIAYCEKQPIDRLSLFGSALRKDFDDHSDIDLLVEYVVDEPVTLLDMAQQEIALSEIIGRKVDLRTPADLSRYFREDVINIAEPIYERK